MHEACKCVTSCKQCAWVTLQEILPNASCKHFTLASVRESREESPSYAKDLPLDVNRRVASR